MLGDKEDEDPHSVSMRGYFAADVITLRREMKAMPVKPMTRSITVPGSGTGVATVPSSSTGLATKL